MWILAKETILSALIVSVLVLNGCLVKGVLANEIGTGGSGVVGTRVHRLTGDQTLSGEIIPNMLVIDGPAPA